MGSDEEIVTLAVTTERQTRNQLRWQAFSQGKTLTGYLNDHFAEIIKQRQQPTR